MSNTQWKLSGATGEVETGEEFDPQFMTQGVGFPLRSVEGVPPQDTGDIFNPDTIDTDNVFMTYYRNGWEQGKAYASGAVVANGIWTMIANKLTFAQPYPQPDGDPTFTIPAFAPTTETDSSVVTSGHQWTLTEDTLIDIIRVWVPSVSATTFYKITFGFLLPGASSPIVSTIDNPVLTAGEFTVVSKQPNLLPSGTIITVILEAIETSGGQNIQGVWRRQGDGIGAPTTGQWRIDATRTILRVNKVDFNSLNRGLELADVGIATTVRAVQSDASDKSLDLLITSVGIDQGVDFQWDCLKTGEGVGGEPDSNKNDNLAFDVPTILVTEYSEELAGLAAPAWATVVPFLEFGGVDQSPLADTAFGVDMEGDITVFNPDWDVFSFAG